MSIIALILLVALLIPIMGIVVDSPIGRALARRLEGPQQTPPGVAELAKKVELLEAEVDDLTRSVQSLQDENAFLQRLLADPSSPVHPAAPRPSLTAAEPRPSRPAVMVAAGILLSRIVGLVRNRVFAHYFGTSDAADAFNAAFRIPNFLQNLFGEGVLSASFIPVYAGLRARGDEAEARRVAGAVAALLATGDGGAGAGRVLLTPWLIAVIAPGFTGEKREVTIRLVRILFPGAGPPGAVGLVPRRPQQPSAVLPQLLRAGPLEPRDHRER